MDSFESQSFGEFFLLDRLGKGGMAEVFLAASLSDQADPPQFLAIKRLLSSLAAQRSFVKKLTDEAKISILLRHPNIVEVYDLGVMGTDFYLSLEWIHGCSLERIFSKLKPTVKRLPLPALFYVVDQIAAALAYAHDAKDRSGREFGIIHRDVTPGNILISYDGTVKLTDFGIATAEQATRDPSREVAFGKLPYMAPEQITRAPVDRKVDLYSLGILFLEGLTLEKPFQASSAIEMQEQILHHTPTFDFPTIQNAKILQQLLSACLAKDPQDRPQSAHEIRTVLKPFLTEDAQAQLVDQIGTFFSLERESKQKLYESRLELFRKARDESTEGADLLSDSLDDLDFDDLPSEESDQTEWAPKSTRMETTRVRTKDDPMPISNGKLGRLGLAKKSVAKPIDPPQAIEEVSSPIHIDHTDAHLRQAGKLSSALPPEEGQALASLEAPSPPSYTSEKTTVDASASPETEPPPSPSPIPGEATSPTTKAPLEITQEESPLKPLAEIVRTRRRNETWKKAGKTFQKMMQTGVETLGNVLQSTFRGLGILVTTVARFLVRETVFTKYASIGLGGLLFLLGLGYAVRWTLIPSATSSVQIENIDMFVTIEGPSPEEDRKEIGKWILTGQRDEVWVTPLQTFFDREYQRFTGDKASPFTFRASPPKIEVPPVEWKNSFFQPFRPFREIAYHFKLPKKADEETTGRLFVHVYPKMFEEPFRYPLDYLDIRPAGEGIVYLPLPQRNYENSLVRLAHETAHLLGASDKYNSQGQAMFPFGYVDPHRLPLYPQQEAELMTKGIPVAPTEQDRANTLGHIRIGHRTASEMGWISAKEADNYYAEIATP